MDLNELHTRLLPFCRAMYRDDAIEVVDFVLEHAGQKSVRFDCLRLASGRDVFDLDPRMTFNLHFEF